MTKYTQKPQTYQTYAKFYQFPQLFSSSLAGVWNTFQTFTSTGTEKYVYKKLLISRDPGAAGNFGIRFTDVTTGTAPIIIQTSTFTVTLTYGGFTILTTTVTAGTHTEVFPGVFITANGTKIVSITLEDFNITSNNMTLDVYEQAAASAQFLVTGQIEKSTTE